MKKILLSISILLLAICGAYASPVAEHCPICLFPHSGEGHEVVPAPVMHQPEAVQLMPAIDLHEEGDDSLYISAGIAPGRFSRSFWLDCLADAGTAAGPSLDARLGMSFGTGGILSFGFEAGALLHFSEDWKPQSYDVPVMLKLTIMPEAGIVSFPTRFGIGGFSGFSPDTREVSFGAMADVSAGIGITLGGHLTASVETRLDALMRLDVQDGRDSMLDLIWVPAVLTLGVRF